jgi:hypothetical protein
MIVCLCLEIDKIADKAYTELADISTKKDFKKFGRRMSAEEKIHIDFWQRICALPVKPSTLPNVFDDPQLVCDELNRIITKAEDLLSRCKDIKSVSDAFVLTYDPLERLFSFTLFWTFCSPSEKGCPMMVVCLSFENFSGFVPQASQSVLPVARFW